MEDLIHVWFHAAHDEKPWCQQAAVQKQRDAPHVPSQPRRIINVPRFLDPAFALLRQVFDRYYDGDYFPLCSARAVGSNAS